MGIYMYRTATIIVLLRYFISSKGVFEVVPSGQTLVCPERQFHIMCSSNDSSFLQWNVTIPYYNVTNTRVISASNTVGHVTPLQVPSVTITFAIHSTSPIISQLSVNSSTANLNGTKIECTERDTKMDRSNEVLLHVINTAQDFPHLTMIRHHTEEFGTQNVTVILEWLDLGNSIVSYDVNIIPPSVSVKWLPGNASVEFTLLYNTPYYVSVAAVLCEQTSIPTITRLSYAKCEEPMVNSNVSLDYNSTVEGSQLILWCSDGLFPNSNIMAQCTEGGIWMPNPAELQCSASPKVAGPSTERDWILLGICVSLGSLLGITLIAFASSVAITGFRKVLKHTARESRAETTQQQEMDIRVSKNAVYEVVRNSYAYNFMLKDNVAYSGTADNTTTSDYEYI